MSSNALITSHPQDIQWIGGFLGQRFQANRTKRIKDTLMSEEFIRLHERKHYDDWFWLGEQIGKWLDAAAYTALIARDDELLRRTHELLDRLAASQEEDGYLGITQRIHRTPARGMELYEMYYVLHGLLVCRDLLESETALKTAAKLGDYIMKYWGVETGQFPLVGPYPGNGHDGGEGTLILEPMVLLAQATGDERYLDWSLKTLAKWDEWWDSYPVANHSCGYTAMQQFAAGSKDVFELRENMHAHTFHMTLLGIAALYNVTGEDDYRQTVLGSIDRLAEEWIFLTGGMSPTERYVPHKYYNARNQIEVCPQHTWILLLQQALQWTGEARYSAEIERDLFNHFFAAQLADGSNWSYFTPLNGRAHEPESPNCRNAAGHRIAARMPTYLYGLRHSAPTVMLYSPSEATLQPPGLPAVTPRQITQFPSEGKVTLQVEPNSPASFALHLAIPPYAQGATIQVGGEAPISADAGEFAVIERTWQPGDSLTLNFPMRVETQSNRDVIALRRGPLVYAYFQEAQPDPVVFHHRRGLYPEDVVLQVDPENIQAVETAAEISPESNNRANLLGPVLHLPARVRARAPLFVQAQANASLPEEHEETVLLHPFANQGAIRGEYRVFMNYSKPS